MRSEFSTPKDRCQWNALNQTGICSSSSAHRRFMEWTEASGLPVGLAIDGANRHDMKRVKATLESIPVDRPEPTQESPQGICLDKGYDFHEVRALVETFGFTAHIRARGEEAKAIKEEAGFRARRWVVERAHGWMNRFRGVLIRWAKRVDTYLAMLHLVCALITWKKVLRVGG